MTMKNIPRVNNHRHSKRIHILSQSEITEQKVVRGRNFVEHCFTPYFKGL